MLPSPKPSRKKNAEQVQPAATASESSFVTRTLLPMNTWFYSDTQHTYGPITTEQLIAMIQAGQLVAGHFIMANGAQEWQALGASPFAGYLPPAAPPVAAPAARPGPPAQRPAQPRPASAHRAPVPAKKKSSWLAIAAVLALAAAGGGYFWKSPTYAESIDVKLDLVNLDSKSMHGRFDVELINGSGLSLSKVRPGFVKKIPPDIASPSYAELKVGPAQNERIHCLLLDGIDTSSPRAYIDRNANGDLTDDQACEYTAKPHWKNDGSTEHEIKAVVDLKFRDTTFPASVVFFSDVKRNTTLNRLSYNGWHARTGTVHVAHKEFRVLMLDDGFKGDFSNPACNFGLDLNGDGKFRYQDGEVVFVHDRFNLNGTLYELSGLDPSGDSFRLVPAKSLIGQPFPSFEVSTLTGEKITLPGSYSGKILLLHFWGFEGTRAHQDLTVIKHVYEKHHTAGLEVLGECWSLEQIDKRSACMKELRIAWPQVSDWEPHILKHFRINSVTNVLIDGDFGKILAIGFHGSGIEPTVAKALAEKRR